MVVMPVSHTMPTREDFAKQQYINGKIDLDEFQRRIDVLYEAGKQDQPSIIDMSPQLGFLL